MKWTNPKENIKILEEIEHFCSPFSIKDTEAIIKSLPQKPISYLGENDIHFTSFKK